MEIEIVADAFELQQLEVPPNHSSSRESAVLMIGETLLLFQKFERLLVAVLLGMVSENEADEYLQKILLRDKQTLGKLLKVFAKRMALPQRFGETLHCLLEQRNLFVHTLLEQPWFDIKTPVGCSNLHVFLSEIRSNMRIALHVLVCSIAMTPSIGESLPTQRRMMEILDRLFATAEPDFGDLTKQQYIEKVVKQAFETGRFGE